MSLETLFKEIRVWQRQTFPNATAKSAANHLLREAKELLEDPTELSELADVFILAIAVADQLGVDIEEVIECKMEVNLERTWGEPDEHGVVEHVRDDFYVFVGEHTIEGEPTTLIMREPKDFPDELKDWEIRTRLNGELPG